MVFESNGWGSIFIYNVYGWQFKTTSRIQFNKYQIWAECAKKRVLTYSAHFPICAKNANLTEKQAKSDILCDLLTHNISLFSFYTSNTQSKQNFFNPDCKFSCNAEESLCCCEIISKTWRTADKQHNAFVFWELISFWIEHWHLVYIRYP